MSKLRDSDIDALELLEIIYSNPDGTKWEPNEGQLEAGGALYDSIANNEQHTQFIRWGRKGGKTDYIIRAIRRHALLNPGSGCYYFCPMADQAREILWETGRLWAGIPKRYIKSIRDKDMRIMFNNGSFIKLDGSNKYEKHRGTEGHFLVYDEFKDFDSRFHEAIDPNRGVYNAPLIILGTPPVSINEDRNYEQYMELQKQCTNDNDKFFLQLSSFVNCHNVPKPAPELNMEERRANGKEYLARKRRELINRGEEYRWKIEYLAENVAMGKNAVFPMINKSKVYQHNVIHDELLRNENKLEWYCVADPGTSTCFAVLFIALNPYSREIWIVDEIYEKDRDKTSTTQMMPRIHAKMLELAPNTDPEDGWIKVADEAGAWFMTEAMNQADPRLNLTFNQTEKFYNEKEAGLGLIKDCLVYNTMLLSDRVVNLYWEMEQYICIDGKYPKLHDHLIDTVRYFLGDANYDMIEALEAKRELKGSRRLTVNSDLDDFDLEDDWTLLYK